MDSNRDGEPETMRYGLATASQNDKQTNCKDVVTVDDDLPHHRYGQAASDMQQWHGSAIASVTQRRR